MNRLFAQGFTGAHFDSSLSGYALGNGYRLLLPSLMRFCAPDKLSPFDIGGLNPYVYCGDDPINHTDPSGHAPVGAIGEALGPERAIDSIAARLAENAGKQGNSAPSAVAGERELGHHAEQGPSSFLTRTRGRKRKPSFTQRDESGLGAKAPRMPGNAPAAQVPHDVQAAPRTLEHYVAQARFDVANDPQGIVREWRARNPGMSPPRLSDPRALPELRTAMLLAADGEVLNPATRAELAERLGYIANRYDSLRSRLTGQEVTRGRQAASGQRYLLTALFGQQWTDGYLAEQF